MMSQSSITLPDSRKVKMVSRGTREEMVAGRQQHDERRGGGEGGREEGKGKEEKPLASIAGHGHCGTAAAVGIFRHDRRRTNELVQAFGAKAKTSATAAAETTG